MLIERAIFTELQPEYRYNLINEEKAEIIIFKYLETAIKDTDGQEFEEYIYQMNIFNAHPKQITEDMVAENPMSFLNYVEDNRTADEIKDEFLMELDYRVSCLELGI